MKLGFYPRLAITGMAKNKKTYVPFCMTAIGIVMTFYIIAFLSVSDSIQTLPGAGSLQFVLRLGIGVIGFFSLVLLFYTHSFLIRRRKREFGLYNILGMGKRNLAIVMVWETVFIALLTIACGLGLGILFSKLAELGIYRLMGKPANFSFSVSVPALCWTLELYGVIFLLILADSLRQVFKDRPVELLRSENVGEKPPRANFLLAFLGAALLAAAYYLAVSIENPVDALVWFFAAVLMVIAATYMLFTAGSVALCRILRGNRRYYYKTNHFISVSTMVYRMKRNGAGLASICILSTMVLVMLSTTTCLYAGVESTLRNRYPRNILVETQSVDDAVTGEIHSAAKEALSDAGIAPENILSYRCLNIAAVPQGQSLRLLDESNYTGFSDILQLMVIPIADYNGITGTSVVLPEGEVLLYGTKGYVWPYDTLTIDGCDTLRVQGTAPEFISTAIDMVQIIPTLYIFVPDMDTFHQIDQAQQAAYGENCSHPVDYYGFDVSCEDNAQIALGQAVVRKIHALPGYGTTEFPDFYVDCIAESRDSFVALYAGLFFLGLVLGLVFLLGTVLIMYYKQIVEGYEDQNRFEILQKVGMTRREIQQSIHSQMLTVFFLPLLTAAVHTAFAFPMVERLMLLLGFLDRTALIAATVASIVLFGVFYGVTYIFTSRAYLGIVSGKK